MNNATDLPQPISLYIHMPWCVKKCPYCDFNSHAMRGDIPENDYINQLIGELSSYAEEFDGRVLTSIFIGGGTPSLISTAGYERLLTYIRNTLPCSNDLEITLEANPGASEYQRFKGYFNAGINRLSIGVQSFNNEQLAKLGRIHSAEDAYQAYHMARKAGFDRINVDLMYALIEQPLSQALDDLKQAINLQPDHISWYQLTLEPNTLFYKYQPNVPDEDRIIDIELAGRQLLAEAHYQQYEISAYAKAEQQCRHNINYWQYGDYLGIGAGAHGKLTSKNGSIIRYCNVKHPSQYLLNNNDKISSKQVVDDSDKPFEFMMNHCRLLSPIFLEDYIQKTGLDADSLLPVLDQLEQKGLIKQTSHSFELTFTGRQFLNDVLSHFLAE